MSSTAVECRRSVDHEPIGFAFGSGGGKMPISELMRGG